MRRSSVYNVSVPELGDRSDITVVSDAILEGEKNTIGNIQWLKATNSGNTIVLKSETRTKNMLKYYNGLSIQFVSPINVNISNGAQIQIDNLNPQPFKTTNDIEAGNVVCAVYSSNGFTANKMGVAVIDNLTTTDSKKALSANQGKVLNEKKVDKTTQVIAGNGLTGGGDLSSNRTFNVVSENDGIEINPDSIQLNTVNNLSTASSTKPLSANQGVVLKGMIDKKVDKTISVVAGKGLVGGGSLSGNITLDVVSENDGILVRENNIFLNVVNDLTTKSSTRALSANMGIKLLNTIDPYTTQFNKKQLLHNFKSLSVDVYHDIPSPELDFYLTYHDKNKIEIDKRTITTIHEYKESSVKLFQESVKEDIKNPKLKITVIHYFNSGDTKLIQSLGGKQ